MKSTLYTDGGARGNPGPAGIGVVLTDEDGGVIAERAESVGVATNNVAEYRALIAGLELAHELGVTDLEARSDSALVVSQVNGEWKIKNETLRPMAVKARSLLNRFASAKLEQVPRSLNMEADKLANQGMDVAMLEERDETDAQQELLE